MVEMDIPAGKAFVHVIDSVLTYWYNTIADVSKGALRLNRVCNVLLV